MRDRPVSLGLDLPEDGGKATVSVNAPRGWTIVTGWGGISQDIQRLQIPAGARDTVVAAGQPHHVAKGGNPKVPLTVVQYFGGVDVAGPVLRIVEKMAASYSRVLRSPMGAAAVVIAESTGGGNWTDDAMLIGYDPDFAQSPPDPSLVHHVAHELFHAWLPWRFHVDAERTVWFHEGFTDYVALRRAAREGLVSKEFFAERLILLEGLLRKNRAWGKRAFGDRKVNWRREPNEEIAYKGGLLLAFDFDVELARDGARAEDMLADFLSRQPPTYDLEAIRAWLGGHGLADKYHRHIEKSDKPPFRRDLQSVGYSINHDGDVRVDSLKVERFLGR